MQGQVRRKIEGGSRVREFALANPSTEPGHQGAVIKLQEILARADILGIQQRTGQSDAQAATSRRLKLRDQIEFGLIGPLAKVGRQAAKDAPELLGKFRINRGSHSHKAFLINGRSMLAEALAVKDLLISLGLASTLLDDLAKALDKFEAETNTISQSRRGHIGARADLAQVASDLGDIVEVLDGFNRYRFQDDPEQLAAWTAARTVVGHSARKTAIPPAQPTAPDGSTKVA